MRVRGPYVYPSGRCAGRAFVVIIEDDGTRRQTLLSRYRMEQHLGRRLRRNELVHHKDEDPTNDALENLEVLTYAEHAARHRVEEYPRSTARSAARRPPDPLGRSGTTASRARPDRSAGSGALASINCPADIPAPVSQPAEDDGPDPSNVCVRLAPGARHRGPFALGKSPRGGGARRLSESVKLVRSRRSDRHRPAPQISARYLTARWGSGIVVA